MTNTKPMPLTVPNSEKERARYHGAQWDWQSDGWFAPVNTEAEDLEVLMTWMTKKDRNRVAKILNWTCGAVRERSGALGAP